MITGFSVTVTWQVSLKLPSMVVTIIFVSPIPFPVTNPPSTTAIELFKEFQETFLLEASDGSTIADNHCCCSSSIDSDLSVRETDCTATSFASGSYS